MEYRVYTEVGVGFVGGVSSCEILVYYVTREYASCGILWCRRTPQCRRRANRSVSERVQ